MSTPLQADLSSVVEKGADVETRYRKISGSTNSYGYLGGWAGETVRTNAVYEEARTSEKKKEKKDKRTFLHAHLCLRM